MDINKLTDLKIKIEKLTFENQKKILKLFLDNNINISENNNGTFILMNELKPNMYEKLINYMDYIENQENMLKKGEQEMNKLNKIYFKKDTKGNN
tara:strand:+ start:1972 stop:2256 length:285 start_codon:yes stop_codon:yes gene_type:complete